MHKIVGIGDVVQRFLNGLPVLLLRGNTLGHIFGGECLDYRGHCAGSMMIMQRKMEIPSYLIFTSGRAA